jgi:hypothetical protein
MQAKVRLILALASVATRVSAQDLAPRAYVITPVGSNAVTFTYSYNNGTTFVDPSIPIEDFRGHFQTQVLTYYHAFNLFGRSANVAATLPYAFANFTAIVAGLPVQAYRSGLVDGRFRIAANLRGGPAIYPKEFGSWREKTTIGASFTILVPTGQYDPHRLINPGTHRWGFKPEVGLTRRWGKWMLDCYGGAWFYTANNAFYPGTSLRTQAHVLNGELHFGRYMKPRLWASLDANFWNGGQSAIDAINNNDRQRNSRLGATVSIPVGPHQSFKFSYSAGAYITIGGNYKTVSAAWQYSWIGRPE